MNASWEVALASPWASGRPCGKRIKFNTGSKSVEGRTGVAAFPTVPPVELLAFFFGSFRVVERFPALNRRPLEGTVPFASPGVSTCRVGQRLATPRRFSRTTSLHPFEYFGSSGCRVSSS